MVDYSDDETDEEAVQIGWVADQIRVGPLTGRVEVEQLYEIFSSFGELVDIHIREKIGKRFALIRYRMECEAKDAVRAMDGGSIDLQG